MGLFSKDIEINIKSLLNDNSVSFNDDSLNEFLSMNQGIDIDVKILGVSSLAKSTYIQTAIPNSTVVCITYTDPTGIVDTLEIDSIDEYTLMINKNSHSFEGKKIVRVKLKTDKHFLVGDELLKRIYLLY